MAISKGNASKEAQEFKRFIGVCPVFVKAVNPNKAEHEKLFDTTLDEAPVYVTDKEDNNTGKTYKNVRLSVVLQPDVEKIGFEMPLITMSFFISNQKAYGATSGKYQVVDNYGRFAWATEDEIAKKAIPTYSNGKKADIGKDYRVAFVGEEDFTNFVRTFLNIPSITKWDNESKTMIPNEAVNPADCECRFDESTFAAMAKGDFSEIKDILNFQPNNKVKVCLGVRTDANSGRLYQSVYTRKFLSNASTNYTSLEKALQADIDYAQKNGKMLSTEYSAEAVHEYVATPTVFTPSAESTPESSDDLPFGESSDSTPWD